MTPALWLNALFKVSAEMPPSIGLCSGEVAASVLARVVVKTVEQGRMRYLVTT